jgi:hypothetical protein
MCESCNTLVIKMNDFVILNNFCTSIYKFLLILLIKYLWCNYIILLTDHNYWSSQNYNLVSRAISSTRLRNIFVPRASQLPALP